MMNAYKQDYLSDAMRNLGGMLDFAVNDCVFEINSFLQMFFVSGIAREIEKGNPKYLAGHSGEELVWIITGRCGLQKKLPDAKIRFDRTPEYWCGWILAYYQWYSGESFEKICTGCPGDELLMLYPALHEASEQKAAEVIKKRINEVHAHTQLRRLRAYAGLTQAALAEQSGVSLRSIQMYEQRRKDINKAQAVSLFRISSVLGCKADDLLEWR